VWLVGKPGDFSQPKVIRGLDRFQSTLETEPSIQSVVGLPTILRSLHYIAGKGDKLPDNEEALEKVTDALEDLLPREPRLERFADRDLSQTHLTVITKTVDYKGFLALRQIIEKRWQDAQKADPALAAIRFSTAGMAPLQAKISYHLVPTLTESFGLTVAIIFCTFLLVFRNGAARLMAMIPSLFAILVMFAIMRLTGMNLNVATIIVASTVLGTSENDQIHFFYHFLEKRRTGSTEEALRHTLLIAGKAILFATLINAGGFLAFALAKLPPIREFGLLSSLAFVLSMLADFTALPAALWMVFRDRPDALKQKGPPPKKENDQGATV
jgi:predicted RND superfamily exporter protein